MRSLVLFCFIISTAIADNFVLLQRACRKRPSLHFCEGLPTSKPVTTEVTVQKGSGLKKIELVLPPPVPTQRKEAPSAEIEFGERVNGSAPTPPSPTDASEKIGSLLSLPKPNNSPVVTAPLPEEHAEHTVVNQTEIEFPLPPVGETTTPASKGNLETDRSVLVFVSEFCVEQRERFVRKCHGTVETAEIEFCKSYPPACAGTSNVIPVLTYCQRYFKEYPTLCVNDKIHELALQFCFAFEQFCLPELTAAAATSPQGQAPKSNLRRCEDVQSEARKVCNPFPPPKDTFNVLRCNQFLSHCKKFVDWE